MQKSTWSVGDIVHARDARWRIADMRAYDECALVSLAGASTDNVDRRLRLLTPFDRLDRTSSAGRWRQCGPRTWGAAMQSVTARVGPADSLWAAAAANIDLYPHQLAPALAVVHGAGSRLLIADEVGLGKTIEAGLVIAELRERGAADRVLVITPAGLRDQWQEELHRRFALPFAVVDTVSIRRRRAELPPSITPWLAEPLVITSIDYAKRPEVLPALLDCHWDVVVVDEAHGATAGERHAAASALCRVAAYVVLLTATPHNGDPGAFASLCTLGRLDDPVLLFRRSRADVGLPADRRVHRLGTGATAAEQRMMLAFDAFARAVQREQGGAAALALSVLRKRACSSAYALERTVRRRLAALERSEPAGAASADSQLVFAFDADGEHDDDEEPAWTCAPLRSADRERGLLERIADHALKASSRETKLGALRRLLRRIREPAIVFTEYRDTLLHLRSALEEPCAVVHGGLSRDERREALAAFGAGRARVLLATDAAGEGLNLQRTCRIVVNFELPWNPVRLEQRIGRIDRIGQMRRVHAFHLVSHALGERLVGERLDARSDRAIDELAAIRSHDVAASDQSETSARDGVASAVCLRGDVDPQRISLEQDRLVEHRRRFGRHRDTAAPANRLFCVARRTRLRRLFGTGAIALIRSALVDRSGHLVAGHAAAVRVRFLPGSPRPAVLRAVEGMTIDDLPQAVHDCLMASRAAHDRFWMTRAHREQSIADTLARAIDSGRTVQRGLFERRDELDWESLVAARRQQLGQARARMETAEATRALTLVVEPMLLLFV